MPCFHTHWLVALQAIPAAPAYILDGCAAYQKSTRAFRNTCVDALSKKNFAAELVAAVKDWHKAIRDADQNSDVSCFSAYMLGACGPDFWTLPSEPTSYLKPATAHYHFDLGHYNRTHRQFEVSIDRVGGKDKSDAQTRIQRSYFLGMATHIAADLVIHQLVNVTAGAYNLLEDREDSKHNKVWENENGNLTVNIWNTHNKVEHFWDTYVRYRYLGDHGPFWPQNPESEDRKTPGPWDDQDWTSLKPFGFPTVEGLIREAKSQIGEIEKKIKRAEQENQQSRKDLEDKIKRAEQENQQSWTHRLGRSVGTVEDPAADQRDAKIKSLNQDRDHLKDSLKVLEKSLNETLGRLKESLKVLEANADVTRFAIEKPLMFPWLVADRILDMKDPTKPFIYSVVVDKAAGAYPDKEVFPEATAEATHGQMYRDTKNKTGGAAEWQKLGWFASTRNTGTASDSFNYLNFIVGPNVEQTRSKGRNVFYDYQALGPFVSLAVPAAKTFLGELAGAYKAGNVDELKKLRTFWNLDTGLGLRIRQEQNNTDFESITTLDFVHVFDQLTTGRLSYTRIEPYLAAWQKEKKAPVKKTKATFGFTKARVFPTYLPPQTFPDVESIYEDKDDQYLERLAVSNRGASSGKSSVCQTASSKEDNKKGCREIRDRLTLCFRAAIADLKKTDANQKTADCEELALFFLGDKSLAKDATTAKTRTWLQDNSKILDYRDHPAEVQTGLQCFATRLLVNTKNETAEDAKKVKRKIAKLEWNDVIPYDQNVDNYGRNFAISTGRRFVLHPIDSGNFDPFTDFSYYDNISPTEQVFFTLYPLVKEDGDKYFDVFSKETLPSSKLDEIKKIDACGVVKLVLIYERRSTCGVELKECYIDGLKAPVG